MNVEITAAAQLGLDAWEGTFSEIKRQQYIDAMEQVRDLLPSSIDCPVLVEFLQNVIHAELQAAPHIIVVKS